MKRMATVKHVPLTIYIHVLQVCLMSQSWDNVPSMHDHLLTVQAHKTTVSCLGKIVH